jgi:hypothetical protein
MKLPLLGVLCLCLCLVTTGCVPLLYLLSMDDEPTQEATLPERTTPPQETYAPPPADEGWTLPVLPGHFDDITYERPNGDWIIARMAELTSTVPGCSTYAGLEVLIDEFEGLYLHVDTQATLTSLYAEFRPNHDHWEDEAEHLDELYDRAIEAKYDFVEALLQSPFSDEVKAQRPRFCSGWEPTYPSETLERLYDEEEEWIDAFYEAWDDATIRYDGRSMDYDDVMLLEDEAYSAAIDLWLEAAYPRLIENYTGLVATRYDIAREEGYVDYAHLAFAVEGRDYTPAQAQALIDDIERTITPFYVEWADYGYYMPDFSMTFDEYTERVRPVMATLLPRLGQVFDLMLSTGFYNVDPTQYKGGAYMTYLLEYGMPFVSMSYEDDAYGASTLVHEFGHFYEAYVMQEKSSAVHDVSEIHSQALQLLFSRHYEDVAGDIGPAMEYDEVLDAVDTLVCLFYTPAVEMQVYALPKDEITADRITDIAHDLCVRYDFAGVSDVYDRYSWIMDTDIIDTPTRAMSYVTSMTVAMDIWAIAQEDERAAIAAYEALVTCDADTLEGVTRAAGLSLPFDDGRCAAILEALERYFTDERWIEYEELYFSWW